MRFCKRIVLLLTILSISPNSFAIPHANSSISHVTVFQNQAKVTRVLPVSENNGSYDVTFSQLPLKLIPSTLRAYTNNKKEIEILGLTHKTVEEEIKSKENPAEIIHLLDTLVNIREPKLTGYLESFNRQKEFLTQFTSTSNLEVKKRYLGRFH